jgi:lysophospholipase L1-like esterase
MATAVLSSKANILVGGDSIWQGKEDLPDMGNAVDQLASRLRLKGYDAVAVCEGGDGREILKYFDPDNRRAWKERKDGENNKPAVK